MRSLVRLIGKGTGRGDLIVLQRSGAREHFLFFPVVVWHNLLNTCDFNIYFMLSCGTLR